MKISSNVCDQKRRSFLKLSGLLGLGAATATLLPVEKMESLLLKKNMYKVSKTHTAMGTYVNMTVVHSSRDEAEHALGLAFTEVDRLVALLTRYGNQSPICELNAENSLTHPAPEIREILGRSLYFHRDTNGAFDVTVKPLVDLFQERFATGRQPTTAEIDATIAWIGSERMRFADNTIHLPTKGMGITLDGVAPGYIADRAAQVLLNNNIVDHLVDAGGEIRVGGAPAKGKAWTVAIQDPNKKKEFPDMINLRQGAVATSGNYEIYYDREKIFHHIVNPKSGHSPQLSTSVTVMAPTAMDADILSTAVFVMEPEVGMRYINARPGYECFVVDRNGHTVHSNGWPT